MSNTITNEEINSVKANMEHIYGQPDPRAYFRELQKVDYQIPDRAKPVFQALIDRLESRKGGPVRALDIGCSYGVNAALLKHDLDMADLYARWTDPILDKASPKQVIDSDRRFFEALPVANRAAMVGLDPSEPAISYAEDTGLLEHGLALNLEDDALPDAAADALAPVDLVMSTGCVGYVTEASFDRLMPAVTRGRSPWLANFVLRMFPFDPIEQSLESRGYVTEKLDGESFVQRVFMSEGEQAGVIDALEAQDIDPAGKEAEGTLIAEFYLSRPEAEADLPLAKLLS